MQGAGVLFVAPDNTALFLKRSQWSEHPKTWDLPGGLTAGGETPEETARREAAEEIGMTPPGKMNLLATTELNGVTFTTFVQRVGETFKPRLNPEHTAFKWISLTSMPESLHPGTKIALSAFNRVSEGVAQAHDAAALAFDRASVRTIDQDGRLHVQLTNISKSNVCPYYGSEIPNGEALGLDPKKVYQLWRDPAELEKAAASFNNIPLMSKHVPVSAHAPQKEDIVGSTGTDAIFQSPYLRNSLVVWDAVAIAAIQSGEQKELSCGYRYKADMTPGVVDGQEYDGVMRNICGNHVALVEQGRAGSDVVVGDSKSAGSGIVVGNRMETSMSRKNPLSRKAAMVKGALAGFLIPKLAQDQKVDLNKLLVGVTAANWVAKKSAVIAGLRLATDGKLAKDASLEDVVGLLDRLDGGEMEQGTEDAPDDMPIDPEAMEAPPAPEAMADPAEIPADPAQPADPMAPEPEAEEQSAMQKVLAYLKGKISDEDLAEIEAMLAEGGTDGGPEPTEEELLAKLKGLMGEGTPDDGMAPAQAKDTPPPTPGAPGDPANPVNSNLKEPQVDKPALDAAIKVAVRQTEVNVIQRMRAIAEAEEAVKPFIGKLVIAQDSAEAVYKLALEAKGINIAGVHPSAFKTMVGMLQVDTPQPQQRAKLHLAHDAASAVSFKTRFPAAGSVRQLG